MVGINGSLTYWNKDACTLKKNTQDTKEVFVNISPSFVVLQYDNSLIDLCEGVIPKDAAYASELINVKTVASTNYRFAALRYDGTVISFWGHSVTRKYNVTRVYSSFGAFAAIVEPNNSVTAWGHVKVGGCEIQDCLGSCTPFQNRECMPTNLYNVKTVYSTKKSFAALTYDGIVKAWGGDFSQKEDELPASVSDSLVDVKDVFATAAAFAALKYDGTVIPFGNEEDGGCTGGQRPDGYPYNCMPTDLRNVSVIFSNNGAFVALLSNGSLVPWGRKVYGGCIRYDSSDPVQCMPPFLEYSETTSVSSAASAFAALLADGTVYSWGSIRQSWSPSGNFVLIYGETKHFADSTSLGAYPCPALHYGSGFGDCHPCPTPNDPNKIVRHTLGIRSVVGSCISCPRGRFSIDGIDCNAQCVAGEMYHSPSWFDSTLAGCRKCKAPGTYYDSEAKMCSSCEKGKFSATGDGTACSNCTQGRYSSVRGMSACDSCRAGFTNQPGIIHSTALSCYRNCDVGMYGLPGDSNGICYDCLPGYKSGSVASTACDLCEPGKFSNESRSALCTPCPTGRYQLSRGASECILCPAGKYSNQTGLSDCISCEEGYVSDEGVESCTPDVCKMGFYPDSGTKECLSCPPGKFSNESTSKEKCVACEKGKFNSAYGQGECSDCPVGKYGAASEGKSEVQACRPCNTSTFNPYAGALECEICPPGNRCSSHGMERYIPCKAGLYSDTKGSTQCHRCPLGTYQGGEGAAKCFPCPAGKYTMFNGSTLPSECLDCRPGTYAPRPGSATCDPCPKGQFQDQAGQIGCLSCTEVHDDATLTNNGDSTACVFNTALSSTSLISVMFDKGAAMYGTFAIAAAFTCLACVVQWNRESSTVLGQLTRFQAVMKSFLPGFSFASELFLIIGMFYEAPKLAMAMTTFRLLHFINAMTLMYIIFVAPLERIRKLDVVFPGTLSLVEDYHFKSARESAPLVGSAMFLCFADFTMLQFLPWKQSLFFQESKGFPSLQVMRVALITKIVQSTASVVCQLSYLLGGKEIKNPTTSAQAKVLFYMNIISSVLVIFLSLILLVVKNRSLGLIYDEQCEEKSRKSEIGEQDELAAARKSVLAGAENGAADDHIPSDTVNGGVEVSTSAHKSVGVELSDVYGPRPSRADMDHFAFSNPMHSTVEGHDPQEGVLGEASESSNHRGYPIPTDRDQDQL